MKARILIASLLLGVVCTVWAVEPAPAGSASTYPAVAAQPQPGDPAYGFNWFNPYAWMALASPTTWSSGNPYAVNPYQPMPQPAASAPATPYGYPAGFNWFDPNAWMGMFFNPAAWGTPPGAAPANPASNPASNPATAYPNTFNWFNPYAWAAMFNPGAWNNQPVPPAVPGK